VPDSTTYLLGGSLLTRETKLYSAVSLVSSVNVLAYAQGIDIGDGNYHAISEAFPTLATAQAYYGSFVTDTAQSLAWACCQRAQSDVTAAGGGTILLPEGTYVFGTPNGSNQYLILYDNTTLAGVGGGSVIKRADNTLAETKALIHNEARSASMGGLGVGFYNTNIHLRDLVVDGGNLSVGALTWAGQDYLQSIWLTRVQDFTVTNVECRDGRYNGLALEYCRNGTVSGCRFYRNLKNGCYLSGSDRIVMNGCHAEGNGEQDGGTTGSGITVAASWFCVIDGCLCKGNTQCGVSFGRDTQHLAITGGTYDSIDTNVEYLGGTLPYEDEHPFPAGPYDGVTRYGAYHCVIAGVNLTGRTGAHAIRLMNCGDFLITGVVIGWSGLHGIQIYGSSGVTVTGCTVRNVNNCGIQIVADATYGIANDNRVLATLIEDTQTVPTTLTGVAVGVSGGGVATGNEFVGVVVDDSVATKANIGAGLIVIQRACSWAETTTQALAFSANWTPDASLGDIITMTLTAPTIIQVPSNPRTGQRLTLVLTQDGTGTRGVTWSTGYKFGPSGGVVDPNPDAVSRFTFVHVGASVWQCVSSLPVSSHVVRSVAYASSFTPTPALGEVNMVGALTGAFNLNAPVTTIKGQRLTFILPQDATGGRNVTFNAIYKTDWTNAAPRTDASKTSVISFVCDGTNWQQLAPVVTTA
jgi:parallel beta-helix repeat protein